MADRQRDRRAWSQPHPAAASAAGGLGALVRWRGHASRRAGRHQARSERADRPPVDSLRLPRRRHASPNPDAGVPVGGGDLLPAPAHQHETPGAPTGLPVLPRAGDEPHQRDQVSYDAGRFAVGLLRGPAAGAGEAIAALRRRRGRRPNPQRLGPPPRPAAMAADG